MCFLDTEGVCLIREDPEVLPNGYTGKTFTVEEAVDSLGMGKFQLKIFVISGLFQVHLYCIIGTLKLVPSFEF